MKHLKRPLSLLLILLSVVFLQACGGGSSSGQASGCSLLNARIFGGDICDQTSRSPVVAIAPMASDGEVVFRFGTCSGALVTVDDLITSAHCFIDPLIRADSEGIEIVGFAVLVGGANGQVLPIVNAAIHPFYNGQVGSRYDIAMATLLQVPSPPIGPLPLLASELTGPGSDITAFGYGTNDQQVDDLLKAADFTISGIEDGNLVVLGDGSNSICGGDSGGPAVYLTSEGIATIAGVNSFGDLSGCVNTASRFFGFVDLQDTFIFDFIFSYAPDVAAR